ncbi:MAG: alanyl-tRNA editing protein [Thermoflexales bacterium]|nr:alanyl-tRNA editing protein [Thermoflexales bacterium]
MTLRLYWQDAYQRTFEARVLQRLTHKGYPAVVLDQTAFYPTAGGQPHDTGKLNGVEVIEVLEHGDDIVHVTSAPIEDEVVHGALNWARRFDHMQQHSGQHVLSQAFVRVAGLDTVAVHIGKEVCTIDLPTAQLAPETVARAEAEANAVVWEDRPIRAFIVDEAEIARFPLRRPPKVRGAVRIVEVQEYDWSACGGTHVRSTAQIGAIKIVRTEKRGNETRVTFICGQRAFADYVQLHHNVAQIMERLSAPRYQVAEAVQRALGSAQRMHKALQEARARLAAYEAEALLAQAVPFNGGRCVVHVFEDRDPEEVRLIARAVCAQQPTVALLGVAGEQGQLIFARAEALPHVDAAALLRQALAALFPQGGVKGGGSAVFAQSGGFAVDRDRLRAVLNALAARLSTPL